MKLLTRVALPEYPFRLDHRSSILLLGSCFTEGVGLRLRRNLFQATVNPFGVMYNPLSVRTGLESLLDRERYREEDLDHYDNLWFSFDHYTLFSSGDRDEALRRMNQRFLRARERMRDLSCMILTWGTAWVYTHRKSGRVVCNCHKIPAKEFTRRRLTPEEIVEAYEVLLPALFSFNPELRILLTVSPVRHWKDGAHQNQLSKATLMLAEEALEVKFPGKLFYFPSYEILMDELRDYRFYAGDMLHPSDQATEYIWEVFQESLMDPGTRKLMATLDPVLKMFEHRSLLRDPEKEHKFINSREEKVGKLKEKYPFLAWENMEDPTD